MKEQASGKSEAADDKEAPLPPRHKTSAAERALAEAAARRAEVEKTKTLQEKEINGPKGPEPTRYGDWERKGIASDF